MNKVLIVLGALSLGACSTLGGNKIDADYSAYLAAHQAATSGYKQAVELVKIEAMPGQQITVSGLKGITVSMPAAPMQSAQQRVQQPNEWASVVQSGIGVVGTVMGIRAAGNAAIGLAGAVGSVARTPQANVTTTTTTNTDSHAIDNHAVTTTTNTDSHAVDNHAVDSHAVDDHSQTAPPTVVVVP